MNLGDTLKVAVLYLNGEGCASDRDGNLYELKLLPPPNPEVVVNSNIGVHQSKFDTSGDDPWPDTSPHAKPRTKYL